MIDVARRLREALVAAYGPYVRARSGDTSEGMDAAISAGAAWLEEALDELLAMPFAEQPRGPLELFQEAMRAPTEYLQGRGVAAVARDEATTAALPGDLYDLAPASSRDLGEEVWICHLAWGTAKAQAMTAGSGR